MPDDQGSELALLRIAWRLDAFDQWRTRIDLRFEALERELQRLVKADEIAEAVAAKMKSERTLQLTFVQKTVALLVGAVAIADGIRGFLT